MEQAKLVRVRVKANGRESRQVRVIKKEKSTKEVRTATKVKPLPIPGGTPSPMLMVAFPKMKSNLPKPLKPGPKPGMKRAKQRPPINRVQRLGAKAIGLKKAMKRVLSGKISRTRPTLPLWLLPNTLLPDLRK